MKFLTFCFTVLLAACSNVDLHIADCQPMGEIRPVCGMQTPEDIARLEDNRHLLLAHFGGMFHGTGSLSLFDTETERLTPLLPRNNGGVDVSTADWGDADCAAPDFDRFRPHGTHLHQLVDGRWRYLVVNHGERETIEMFELVGEGAQSSLTWRGCLEPAPETFMNDAVGLPNGDVIYTRMLRTAGSVFEQLLSVAGFDTGELWRWNQVTGLRRLSGTEANQPNGIEVSSDGRHVFANMYMTQELWKVDVDSGEVVATASVTRPDNSAWGSDGRLWVASHSDSIPNMLACAGQQETACGARFQIVAVEPETMATETIFEHQGPPMGAATVAVAQAGRVYMGSFVGDRLISMPDFTLASP